MRRSVLFLILSLILLSENLSGKDKQVLVLNSYHQGYHWTDRIMGEISEVLGERDDTELQVVYMDTKHFSDPFYLDLLYSEYAYKYAHTRFDAILSTDDHALDFLLKYGDRLFPDTPVVFCGINVFDPVRIAGHDNYTGIHEAYDLPGILELMTNLHPRRTDIAVIMDSTLSSEHLLRLVHQGEILYSGRLNFHYYTGLSNADLKEQLKELDDNDLILWGIHLRGNDGEFFSVSDSLDLIRSATAVPIYSIWDVVGSGVVGGKVARPEEQGRVSAHMVDRILEGTPVQDIPVMAASPLFLFDYHVLREQGIKLSALPRGSIIINKPFQLIRENKTLFSALLIFVVILLVIIGLLFRVIAKRKRTEEQLFLSREELGQSRKMDAIGQLAGGVAHDFNNILTGILGAADMLDTEETLSGQGKEYVKMIISSSEQAADLTSQLLAFGRKSPVLNEEIDVHKIIDNTFFILKQTLSKKITLKKRLRADNHRIQGNKAALQNIIMNLCINASQAMDGDGTIIVETVCLLMNREHCNVLSPYSPAGIYLKLTVSDRGCGIPQNDIDKIFEPFYTTKGRGSGLGLAAVYGTMKDHRGCISVESEVGKGTDFHLYFPQKK